VRSAVLDTNVYIDFWERSLHAPAVQAIHTAFVVRHAAVVLSELRRGARTQQARRTVEALYRVATSAINRAGTSTSDANFRTTPCWHSPRGGRAPS
jgi:predicted nucleic acid-binding protein